MSLFNVSGCPTYKITLTIIVKPFKQLLITAHSVTGMQNNSPDPCNILYGCHRCLWNHVEKRQVWLGVGSEAVHAKLYVWIIRNRSECPPQSRGGHTFLIYAAREFFRHETIELLNHSDSEKLLHSMKTITHFLKLSVAIVCALANAPSTPISSVCVCVVRMESTPQLTRMKS